MGVKTTSVSVRFLIPAVVLAAGFFVSFVILAQAQGIPSAPSDERIDSSGIAFPVAELGNCGNKIECKRYCDDSSHLTECIAFAEKHGLMNKEEASRARKFSSRLQGEGGPGGCRGPRECKAFCEDMRNIDECLAFADAEGIDDSNIKEARRIQMHLKAGGQMPGGCTSKAACETYCAGDLDRMEECLVFAEQVGLEDLSEDGRGPENPQQIRKFIQLAKSGGTPGGCVSKDQCEAYCEGEGNFDECIAFAERMGFVSPEEAEMARKTGGRGPGDCKGERECRDYCNDPANREVCFEFAEAHGLIAEEDLEHMREGMVRLRQGLEHALPEVEACLKSYLGPNVIDEIQAGTFAPGPDVGERIRGCFEKFGGGPDPREIFDKVPPEMLDCVRDKLGGEFDALRSGEVRFTPEKGDVFRICGDQMRLQAGGFFGGEHEGGPDGGPPGLGGGPGAIGGFLRSAPPGVAECLRGELGDEFEALKTGEIQPGPEMEGLMRGCFQVFRPDDEHRSLGDGFPGAGGPGAQGFGPSPEDVMRIVEERVPPEMRECVKGEVGPDFDLRHLGGILGRCQGGFDGGSGDHGERDDIRRRLEVEGEDGERLRIEERIRRDGDGDFRIDERIEHREGDFDEEFRRELEGKTDEERAKVEEEMKKRRMEGGFPNGAGPEDPRGIRPDGFPQGVPHPGELPGIPGPGELRALDGDIPGPGGFEEEFNREFELRAEEERRRVEEETRMRIEEEERRRIEDRIRGGGGGFLVPAPGEIPLPLDESLRQPEPVFQPQPEPTFQGPSPSDFQQQPQPAFQQPSGGGFDQPPPSFNQPPPDGGGGPPLGAKLLRAANRFFFGR